MLCCQLYTGNIPFFDKPDPNVIVMVTRGERPSKPASAEEFGLTLELWELTKRCWHEKPERRPDAFKVLTRLESMSLPTCLVGGEVTDDKRFLDRGETPPSSLLQRLKGISRG